MLMMPDHVNRCPWRPLRAGMTHDEALRAAGVAHLVHTSSPSVVYNGQALAGADEGVGVEEAVSGGGVADDHELGVGRQRRPGSGLVTIGSLSAVRLHRSAGRSARCSITPLLFDHPTKVRSYGRTSGD